jgi:glycerol-3-phosphate dehydrogenase
VLLYDTMGGRHGVPGHRHLTRGQALQAFPALKRSSLVGAVRYYDGQVDDARHTMMLVRTATRHGASCASSARVVGFLREDGHVTGALVRDLESGMEHRIRASRIINAAGVYTDEIQQMIGGRGRINVRASKGVHLVVPKDRISAETGIISRTEKSVLFIIPWNRSWIIGTTDTDWHLDRAHPAASRRDVEYLLEQANRLLQAPLTRDDVVGVYAGLRPLLAGESDDTSRLSREHAVAVPAPGMVLVAGGKYTTYRVMAKDAVDAAVADLPGRVGRSCTDRVPLLGAEGYLALRNRRHQLARESGLHVDRIEHLLNRYGSLTPELLDLIAAQPPLGEPIPGAAGYLMVEAHYSVLAEGALHLDDVLARRTRISIETEDRGIDASEPVASLMAPLLGWDEARTKQEIEHYRARVEAERDSQEQPDDQTADAARLSAPDVRQSV